MRVALTSCDWCTEVGVGYEAKAAGRSEVVDVGELKAFHTQLTALAKIACEYPLEYALGSYELLFETRNDIETIAANLVESIADLRSAA